MGISSLLVTLNAWVESHLQLISVIGIPLLTFLVTQISNSAAERRSAKDREVERRLAVELKLVEFRQAWIDGLRDDFAAFISAAGTPESEGAANIGTAAVAKINLRVNPRDPDFELLIDRMHVLSSMIHCAKDEAAVQAWGEANADFVDVGQRILRREWERLKVDLREARL